MSDNKAILKLHFRGYSQRQIAESVKAAYGGVEEH